MAFFREHLIEYPPLSIEAGGVGPLRDRSHGGLSSASRNPLLDCNGGG